MVTAKTSTGRSPGTGSTRSPSRSLGVDAEEPGRARRAPGDRPQLIGLVRGQRRQAGHVQVTPRGRVPDQTAGGLRDRAGSSQRDHPRARIAQQVHHAAGRGQFRAQRGLLLAQTLTEGARLTRHAADLRLVPCGDEHPREEGDETRRHRPGDPWEPARARGTGGRGRRRGPARLFGGHAGHQGLLHGGRRHHGRRLAREEREGLLTVVQSGRTLGTPLREVGLEHHPVLAIEGAQRVTRGQGRVRIVINQGRFATSRSRSSPSRILVLTVPRGCFVRSAISDCVSPP